MSAPLAFVLGFLAGIVAWFVYLHTRATKEMRKRASEYQHLEPTEPWSRHE